MKRMKKIVSLLLVVIMTFAMNLTAFAQNNEQSYTITITNAKADHVYEAYQVFTGDLSEDGTTLSNIEWGSAVKSQADALLTELKDKLDEYEDCESAADVAKVLEQFSANAEKFADIAEKYLTDVAGTSEDENGLYVISVFGAGYYLVKDKDDSVDKTDAYTDFILKVVSDVKVTPKSDVPAMEKKVREDDKYAKDGGYGEGYNDVADWNIGDTVPYKLIGTIPDEEAMDAYDEYYYAFHDDLTDKFTLIGDSVKVYIASDKSGTDKAEIDGSLWNLTPTENGYTLSFDNLKDIPGIDSDKYIIVEYDATFKENAEVGLPGNPTDAYLEFSNNPNPGGEDSTGQTPEDKVIVFTYMLTVTKIDAEDKAGLENATFKLYRGEGEYVKVESGIVTGWTGEENEGTIFTSDSEGSFHITGLDDGTYYLEEIQAPDGYNKIVGPIPVQITAVTVNDQNWAGVASNALKEISVDVNNERMTGNIEEGLVSIEIRNTKGSILPSTGGMGTTVFYVLGAAIVLGAGTVLVLRKCLGKK